MDTQLSMPAPRLLATPGEVVTDGQAGVLFPTIRFHRTGSILSYLPREVDYFDYCFRDRGNQASNLYLDRLRRQRSLIRMLIIPFQKKLCSDQLDYTTLLKSPRPAPRLLTTPA
jgi:hypothetical protein